MKQRISCFFKRRPALSFSGTTFLFIVIEGLFSFCSRTTCPAFADATFDQWFPYKAGQTVYFTSTTNRKDTLTINFNDRSGEHEIYGRPDRCDSWASVSSLFTPAALRFDVYLNKYTTGNALSVTLNDFRLTNAALDEQQITTTDSTVSSRLLTNFVINGKTFPQVVQLQRDTIAIKTEGIYKIWLSKGTGLAGYESYPAHEQWVKD